MKNFTLLLAAAFLFVTSLSAQTQRGSGNTPKPPTTQKGINSTPQRCGVDEMIQQRLQTDPAFKAKYEEGLRQYQESINNAGTSRTTWATTLTGPVTIPVAVHIVLPDPTIVTDADVIYFINRLNLDFAGTNRDSTNGSLFYNVRGHSFIRFALARRTPGGALTTGIERRVGGGTINLGNPQPIKSTAQGGLDAWDVTQYYNFWVGIGAGGLLGIAPEIGPGGPAGSANTDGVCVDYRAFTKNACFTITEFNLARTAVHEIGHNFGLYHTFQGGCATVNDFGQMTSSTSGCASGLPDALLAASDDTPAQSANTAGCPSGAVAAGCAQSPNPPGKMYQNYMDYTDDACYSMFTIGQVNRMHYVLENCRPGYLTTQGHIPPAGTPANDAALTAVVRPGGNEITGIGKYTDPDNFNTFTCVSHPNPTCGGVISPRVRIQNNGSAPMTSVTVFSQLNSDPAVSQTINFSGPLAMFEDTVVTIANITLVASNTLKFWTSAPNGAADPNNANDTITKVLNFTGGALPLTQGFESTTFPPAGWSIANPNNNVTWIRAGVGNASAASAFIDNANNNNVGQTDDIISATVNTAGLDSLIIQWDFSHKQWPGFNDRFDVLVSTNCGASYQVIWTRTDPALANAGQLAGSYTAPTAADWIRHRVSIGSNITGWGGNALIAFRNVNGYSNNTFVDNINISAFVFTPRDLSAQAILRPNAAECSPSVTPSMTVRNTGTAIVNNFQVGYILDGGAPVIPATTYGPISPNTNLTITFAAAIPALTPGNHTIKLFTTNPDGQPDLFPSNDTITRTFNIKQLVNSLSENFEGAAFPPATMQINNPNGNNTWVRDVPGRNSVAGAEIDNYSFFVIGNIDDMQLIPVSTNGVDSVVLSFDVAHKNYPGLDDVLSVVASTDCGNTFLPTPYSKPGTVLATAGSSTAQYATAGPADWRTERVAIGGAFMTSGNVILAIRNVNGYGNMIHIDNINVTKKYRRDLQLASIDVPVSVVCAANATPSVTVRNVGSETVTAFDVVYQIDNGTPATTTVNQSIAPNGTLSVTLSAGNFTVGPHTIKAWTASPVGATGTGDLNLTNDTLSKGVTRVGSQAPPITEGFEGTTFPPAGWGVINADGAITWRRTTAAASSGIASAFVNNYNYNVTGLVDDLYTPQLTYTGADSVSLKFDVAALTFSYPGSTAIPLDTLEVLITKDCGTTFTSVYKKAGHELQTVSDPNNSQPYEFFPAGKSQWRTEAIDLTGLAAGNGSVQVVFRNTSNFENNIFIDNVSVTTRTLPGRLKNEGFLILPSPFSTSFTVWHYQQPSDLKFITVYNSAGQQVWRRDFSGNADKQVMVDLSNKAAGVYTVHLGYMDSNRNTSTRVVKF